MRSGGMYEQLFWVLLGVVLGLPINILANVYNDRIQDRLDKLKLSRHGKRRDKALVEYRRLHRIHHGTRDKRAFIGLHITRIISLYVISISILVAVPLFAGNLVGGELDVDIRSLREHSL
jgi:hypothetical protein